jgi:hypothetical protein
MVKEHGRVGEKAGRAQIHRGSRKAIAQIANRFHISTADAAQAFQIKAEHKFNMYGPNGKGRPKPARSRLVCVFLILLHVCVCSPR